MRKLTNLLLAAGASALLLAGTSTAAQAEPHAAHEAASPLTADGKFHIYRDAGYQRECGGGYAGNVSNYTSLLCNDQVSSVINSGYPGNLDDVWMYKDAGYTGSRRGIYNGVGIIDLQWFAYDDGAPMNDTMSSHHWTNLP